MVRVESLGIARGCRDSGKVELFDVVAEGNRGRSDTSLVLVEGTFFVGGRTERLRRQGELVIGVELDFVVFNPLTTSNLSRQS